MFLAKTLGKSIDEIDAMSLDELAQWKAFLVYEARMKEKAAKKGGNRR